MTDIHFPLHSSVEDILPEHVDTATLLFRVMTEEGPSMCTLRDMDVIDITRAIPTVGHLLRSETTASPLNSITTPNGVSLGSLDAIVSNTDETHRDPRLPYLLAPIDIQAVKASGVTFVDSLVERVVEEMSLGNPDNAQEIRNTLDTQLGGSLKNISPGSPEAKDLKVILQEKDLWSQYLEVGLGPDAEIFTKAQPLSAVGYGATVGLHPRSHWNNPEPEVVLIIDTRGRIVGVSLGNDVNLRDFEGRSALLLGRAKDNNASCAIGPFIRLFDDNFSLDDVRTLDLSLNIIGPDGYVLDGQSSMAAISRDPADLVYQLTECHQYPDGAALFTGTLFAPNQDRDQPGQGFTHKTGDVVTISTPLLGTLTNRVGISSDLAPWDFGAVDLFRSLVNRGINI